MTTISTLSDLIEGSDYWLKSNNFDVLTKVKCLVKYPEVVLFADMMIGKVPTDSEINQALHQRKLPEGSFTLRADQLSGNTIIKIN